ncbi:MAG: cell division protein ZapA [Gemmatimonadales bacterium]
MSGKAVEVTIGGHRLLVSSDHSADYTARVAAHFDAEFQRIRAAMPTVDAQRAAILAGLAVTDELFQVRGAEEANLARIAKVTEQLARLVPLERRGGGGQD